MKEDRSIRTYALLATSLASFLTAFTSNAMNLAIKAIGTDLQADALTLNWVVAVYLVAAAATAVPFGRAADLYGRKKVFVIGLAVYGLTSAFAAVANSVQWLIALRALQGIGGAMLFATSVAILTSIFPPKERGRVLGINVASVYTGLSLGPVLGGLLTDQFGWRSIFTFNALLALPIVPLTLLTLRGEWTGAAGERFDWAGTALYGTSLVALTYGLPSLFQVSFARWLILGAALGLLLFVVVEMRLAHPVLDLRRFRGNIVFIFSNLAALIHYSATFAITYLLSLYLQTVKILTSQQAGLVLVAQPVMMAVLSPPAGWLSDRVEPRWVASLGMALTGAGLFALSTFGAGTPVWVVVGLLLFIGTGYAFFSSPNANAVMSSVVVRDYGIASSALGTMRLIGQSLSMAVVQLLFSVYVGQVQIAVEVAPQLLSAMMVAFRIFAGLAVPGVLASLARGKVRTRNTKRDA